MPNPATQSDTSIDIDSLQPGPITDALVAERIMEWKYHDMPSAFGHAFPNEQHWFYEGQHYWREDGKLLSQLFNPSTSPTTAHEMETEIERQGRHQKYVDALIGILYRENPPDDNLYWAIRHASAFQCCKAALKAGAERGC